MKRFVAAAAVFCALGSIFCGGGDSPSAPTSSTASQTPAPTPTPAGPRIGPGQHLIGTGVQPGRYYTDPVAGCYWERLSGLGGTLNEVIANEFIDFNAGQWIVDILASDRAFSTDAECATWTSSPVRGVQANITPGVWLVGSQINPGTYTANVGAGCYWERLRNFENRVSSSVIANDFISTAGSRFVTVSASDVGFHSDGDCGTWTPATAGAGVSAQDAPSAAMIERNWRLNQDTRMK